jgi:hypothetical protein
MDRLAQITLSQVNDPENGPAPGGLNEKTPDALSQQL